MEGEIVKEKDREGGTDKKREGNRQRERER